MGVFAAQMGDTFADGRGEDFQTLAHGGRLARQVDDKRPPARPRGGA
jgi:hypothetical protein